jgi:hypothetical protein
MKLRPLAVAIALAALGAGAAAAPVTLNGANFSVTYDDAVTGLFGTPTLADDALYWFPSGTPGFSAQTDGGIQVRNASFAMVVTAAPGFFVSGLSLAEGGEYFHFGGARSGVMASGQLRVTPLPGSTVVAPLAGSGFAANAAFDFTPRSWTAAAAVELAPGTTTAATSIQNVLSAYVLPGAPGYAFIEKRDVVLAISVTPVPEPQTYALMLAGVGVVLFVVLRRRR